MLEALWLRTGWQILGKLLQANAHAHAHANAHAQSPCPLRTLLSLLLDWESAELHRTCRLPFTYAFMHQMLCSFHVMYGTCRVQQPLLVVFQR